MKSQGSIADWIAAGYIPPPRGPDQPNRILEVEQDTGVHRHYLNKSVYPDEPPTEQQMQFDALVEATGDAA